MKKFRKFLGFIVAVVAMILTSGNAFAMANAPAVTDPVGPLDNAKGVGVGGANTLTQSKEIMENQLKDLDYYQKQQVKIDCGQVLLYWPAPYHERIKRGYQCNKCRSCNRH